MIYILDANTLIDAKRDYFQFQRVPEFWEWLQYQGEQGNIKIPIEIYEEFEEARSPDGERDDLSEWAADPDVKNTLLLNEEAEPSAVSQVIENGYATDLTDEEVEKLGRDPFLISYALTDIGQRVIVSTEVSRPSKKRANRKVPDVCNDLGITCINSIRLIEELDFKTDWRG